MEMKAKQFIQALIREKGESYAGAVTLAAYACALAGMIDSCEMVKEEQDAVNEQFAEFAATAMAGLVDALGASHDAVRGHASVYMELAKADAVAVIGSSRSVIARAARH